jgi:SAM-dependent methyltransferase
VLDIGSGHGQLSIHALRIGVADYLGVDVSAEAVKIAQTNALAPARFIVGDFNSWKPDSSFDVIIFNESIYYAPDPLAVFRALRPLAKHAIIISMCEYANHSRIWQQIESELSSVARTRVENEHGQAWNIRLFRTEEGSVESS